MAKDLNYIKRNARILTQAQPPVLTGNLQQNAIQGILVHNGALIYVDDNIAPYGAYLDDGKVPGKGQDSIGWFSNDAYNAIQAWVESDFNGRSSALRSSKEIVKQNEPDTIARQIAFNRNIRRTGL